MLLLLLWFTSWMTKIAFSDQRYAAIAQFIWRPPEDALLNPFFCLRTPSIPMPSRPGGTMQTPPCFASRTANTFQRIDEQSRIVLKTITRIRTSSTSVDSVAVAVVAAIASLSAPPPTPTRRPSAASSSLRSKRAWW